MALPSGKIVDRPMVVRACGHKQEFQFYSVDKYRAQRLAKFQQTRCSACVEALAEEQKKVAATIPKKGEALKSLPTGAEFSLTRQADGSWKGTLTADGKKVEAAGDKEAGPQSVLVALARLWIAENAPETGGE